MKWLLSLLLCGLPFMASAIEPRTNVHLYAIHGITVGNASTNLPGTFGYTLGYPTVSLSDSVYYYLLYSDTNGNANIGWTEDSGVQVNIGGAAAGCLNLGMASGVGSVQSNTSQALACGNIGYTILGGTQVTATSEASGGCYNIGHVSSGGSQSIGDTLNGNGVFNIGYVNAGTQSAQGFGSLNFGALRTSASQILGNTAEGAFNFGDLQTGGMQTNRGSGTFNLGYVNTGTQSAQGQGSMNLGYVNAGTQSAQGQGSMNLGSVSGGGQYLGTGVSGSFNFGRLETGTVQTNNGHGCFNFGFLTGAGAVQYVETQGSENHGFASAGSTMHNTGDAAFIFGALDVGEYVTNSATGTFSMGANIRNTNDYASVFGYGINSIETNAAHARVFIAFQRFKIGATAGVTVTQDWVDNNSVTNEQTFTGGILTAWTTNGVSCVP